MRKPFRIIALLKSKSPLVGNDIPKISENWLKSSAFLNDVLIEATELVDSVVYISSISCHGDANYKVIPLKVLNLSFMITYTCYHIIRDFYK